MIEEYIKKINPKNILDFGWGNGSFDYKNFQGLSITAVDKIIPEKAYEFSSNVKFIQFLNNEEPLPFTNYVFDFVIMNFVLEHVPNPLYFIKQSERLLINNGYLYIAIPNYKSLQDRLFRLATTIVGSRQGPHIQKFTFQNFLELIYSNTSFMLFSFHITESEYSFMLNNPFLKLFHKPWMLFMTFLKRIKINLLKDSDYILVFKKCNY